MVAGAALGVAGLVLWIAPSFDPPTPTHPSRVVDRIPWRDTGIWLSGETHAHYLLRERPGKAMIQAAVRTGLDFIATTDHAHRLSSRHKVVTPRLRQMYPELILLAGAEWNVPGGDHATLLVEQHPAEWQLIDEFTRRFDRKASSNLEHEEHDDGTWGDVNDAIGALRWLDQAPQRGLPQAVVFLNHLSRHDYLDRQQIQGLLEAGLAGVEAAPGHQRRPDRNPTHDRYDPFLAVVGGGYDHLELGRHVGIVAGSDFHKAETAYYPGEFSRTLVYCPERSSSGVIEGLRRGATATILGGIVRRVDTGLSVVGGSERARISEVLEVGTGAELELTVDLDVPPVDFDGRVNTIEEVELISSSAEGARAVKIAERIEPGMHRLTYRLDRAATSSPGTLAVRVRGRRSIGGAGSDQANADYLFYTAATRVVVAD